MIDDKLREEVNLTESQLVAGLPAYLDKLVAQSQPTPIGEVVVQLLLNLTNPDDAFYAEWPDVPMSDPDYKNGDPMFSAPEVMHRGVIRMLADDGYDALMLRLCCPRKGTGVSALHVRTLPSLLAM
jgi:hypothetical protein